MHYLKKEFDRLVKYTQGLDVKVTFSREKQNSASAAWTTDGKEIIIYDKTLKGPLQLLLDFLHELSHHRAYIENGRKENLKTNKILDKEASGKELTASQRKHMYEGEMNDYKWQLVIHNEVGSKIPLWRLQAEIDLDTWIYRHYWLKAEWPLMKDVKAKRREFMKKNKG